MSGTIEVYCTVITGFEKVAAKEISQKLPTKNINFGRGNVRFSLDIHVAPLTLQLRSVDNLFVVFYEKNIDGLTKMPKEEALRTLQEQISFCNWKQALDTWQLTHPDKILIGGTEKIIEQMRQFMREGVESPVIEDSPNFRVTCKRCGEKEVHQFSSMDAASKFGAQINNVFGWKCSVKQFDIEVALRIDRNQVTMMMALNDDSLFKRNICAYGPTTMRATMCFCMLLMADIRPGDVVIDPMCGGGSIPIEGANSHEKSIFLGGDNHELALERCRQNWSATHRPNCEFSTWDATNLPLPDGSVDVVVTDLPFGKKIGSTTDNRLLYPKLLEEWKRVLRKGGRMVLMTHDKRSLENSILKDRSSWQTDASHVVNVGGLSCLCLRLSKC